MQADAIAGPQVDEMEGSNGRGGDDDLRFHGTVTMTGIKEFRFLHPMEFLVGGEDGVVLVCDRANLYGCGKTMEEAVEDVYVELDHKWRSYALGDESGFHESAVAYKRWLLENVERRDEGAPAVGPESP